MASGRPRSESDHVCKTVMKVRGNYAWPMSEIDQTPNHCRLRLGHDILPGTLFSHQCTYFTARDNYPKLLLRVCQLQEALSWLGRSRALSARRVKKQDCQSLRMPSFNLCVCPHCFSSNGTNPMPAKILPATDRRCLAPGEGMFSYCEITLPGRTDIAMLGGRHYFLS